MHIVFNVAWDPVKLTPVLIVCQNSVIINPLNAELNSISHLLALLGAHHILHVGGLRVNWIYCQLLPVIY